jgi:ribonucleoside-triphosphate reductase
MSYVPETNRFQLSAEHTEAIARLSTTFGFSGLGEVVYYRTYSRLKEDGTSEQWSDTVLRVINGVFSIRKNHYIQNDIAWDEAQWQAYAYAMARSLFAMEWMPAGRGLWAMGTDFVYERGSMALNNCGACDTTDLSHAAEWAMDALMVGVGVGFNTAWEGKAAVPDKSDPLLFVIPDSREGWAASVRLLIEAYTKQGRWHTFDYAKIRPYGTPIRGFGGTASGYRPLKQLHERIEHYLDDYCAEKTDKTRCIADVFNAIGVCIVAGNVRRSAQLALGRIDDSTFMELKDYDKHPERASIGWMSNNAVIVETKEELQKLSSVAESILKNGEPGIFNLANVKKYARLGEESHDRATLTNPCGEIPLESFELCNLAEVFPRLCKKEQRIFTALEYATFYASTVSLLPTHRSETNEVVSRNRRIGVSIGGVAEYLEAVGMATFKALLAKGYRLVKEKNVQLAEAAGVRPSLRVTTIKPSGTISQLAGVTPGIHHPTFRYALRRIRIGDSSPICTLLKSAGVPHEKDYYSENTTVFAFPIEQENAKSAGEVSAREQLELLALLQKEWSDNMISCTIYFDPQREGEELAGLLQRYVPKIKSVSMLPHTQKGVYPQMPYEGISREEYEKRSSAMRAVDFSGLESAAEYVTSFCPKGECEI